MSKVVYHVSSTLQLPWIVESGELRPYPNEDVGIGHTTFLWATTKRAGIGDQTSYGARLTRTKEAAWQEDLFRLVRFTLPAEGFLTWRETVRQQGWTDAAVAELVASDREHYGEVSHDQWCCRADPLRLTDVLKVEVRAYAGSWQPIELDPGQVVRFRKYPNYMGYRLDRRKTFFGTRTLATVGGVPFYVYRPPMTDEEYAEAAYEARRKAEEEDQDDGYRDWD